VLLAFSALSSLPPEVMYINPPIIKNKTAKAKAKPKSQLIMLKIKLLMALTPLPEPKEQFRPCGQGMGASWAEAVSIGNKNNAIIKQILANLRNLSIKLSSVLLTIRLG
jgi:hypothetical protein